MCETVGLLIDSSSSVASEANSNWRGGGGLVLTSKKKEGFDYGKVMSNFAKNVWGGGGRASPWIIAYAVGLWNLTN